MLTPLAFALAAMLVWSACLHVFAVLSERRGVQVTRRHWRLHALGAAGILVVSAAWFFGFDQWGSPRIPRQAQRRIEHRGFYTGTQGLFVFAREASGEQFPLPLLDKGELISLRPAPQPANSGDGRHIPNWIVRLRCWRYPLRIAGECRNLNPDWWLQPGDTVRVQSEAAILEISWQTGPGGSQTLFYSAGTVDQGNLRYDVRDVVLTRRIVLDGISLGALLRRPAESFAAQAKEPPEGLLAAARDLTLVRERLGDAASRLGILVASSFDAPNRRLFKNGTEVLTRGHSRIENPVPAGTLVSYGLGLRRRVAMRLPAERSPELGPIVKLPFDKAFWWPLPPGDGDRDLLISSRREDTPFDGYWIDAGDNEHAIYAKAKYLVATDRLELADAQPARSREDILLGTPRHGVVVGMAESRQAVAYTGWIVILLLLAHTAWLCLWLSPDGARAPGVRPIAAFLSLWELTLALLFTRALLAFRISLLPPVDAPATLFDNSLRVSVWALAVIPVVIAFPLFWNRARQHRFFQFRRYRRPPFWVCAALAGFVAAYVLLAWGLGRPESFLWLRVNNTTVALSAMLLAIAAPAWTGAGKLASLGAYGLLLLPLALNVTLLNDRGSTVYLLPFLLAGLLRSQWRWRPPSAWRTPSLVIAASLLALLPLAATWAGRVAFRSRQIGPETETLFYRLMPLSDEQGETLTSRSTDGILHKRLLLANVQQSWQMQLYAAEGSRQAGGFGAAPLSDRGLSYPVMLTDALFSSLVLSEHGLLAGWLLIGVYLSIAFSCLRAGWWLPDSLQHRVLPLTVLSGLVGLTAIYMASANVGMAVLTGLNLPLLGLYSGSDCVAAGILLSLAAFLMVGGVTVAPIQPVDKPSVMTAARAFLAGLGLWWGALLVYLLWLGTPAADRYRNSYRLPAPVLVAMRESLAAPGRNPDWELQADETLGQLAGAQPPILLKLAVDEFNRRANKRDPSEGFVYLAGRSPQINEDYFNVESPFRKNALWRGRISAQAATPLAAFALLGQTMAIPLSPDGRETTIYLDEPIPLDLNSGILIAESRQEPRLVGITQSESNVAITSKHVPGWKIFVEGRDLDATPPPDRRCIQPAGGDAAGCSLLRDRDVIVLERRRGESVQGRHHLVYLGKQVPSLGETKWLNGGEHHIYPARSLFPAAWAMTHALDSLPPTGRPNEFKLTLDLKLQKPLQEAITAFAAAHPAYEANNDLHTPSIGVAAIDAFSGEVLALGGWPLVDPGAAGFDERTDRLTSAEQRKLLIDPNFRNHPIGSTFKPLAFAAVAAQLAPDYRLEKMTVFNLHDAAATGKNGDRHPHTRIAGVPLQTEWDCRSALEQIDPATYLVRSLNYYQAMVGLIGSLRHKEDWKAMMVEAPNGEIGYAGKRYHPNPLQLPGWSFAGNPNLYARPQEIKDTLLFRGLADVFPVTVGGSEQSHYTDECARFLPSIGSGMYARMTAPQPVVLQPQDFQEYSGDYLRGLLLGSWTCHWNNIRMAEAAARLVTGRPVMARLESGKGPAGKDLPAMLRDDVWRSTHLIQPLRNVIEDDTGTAHRLNQEIGPPYTVIGKTGTIDAGARGREHEALMLVAGLEQGGRFVEGKTIALYLFLEQSKLTTQKESAVKMVLGRQVLKVVGNYLRQKDGAPVPPPALQRPPSPAAAPLPDPPVAEIVPPATTGRLEDMVEQSMDGIVTVETDRGSGTGFFVGQRCSIVTNRHVVESASRISIITHSGLKKRAHVLARPHGKDLVLLRADVSGCAALTLADSRPRLAETVIAIGNPLDFRETVTSGIVSQIGVDSGVRVIQTDAAINHGNSGGPLLNRQGRVVGVNTFVIRGAQGISFAISADEVRDAFAAYLK
jgi:hypothetical protein